MRNFITTTLIALVALFTVAGTTANAQELGSVVYAEISPGDANADRGLDEGDVKTMLDILFGGAQAYVCERELDHNGDGRFDIADVDAAIQDLNERGPRQSERVTVAVRLGDTNDDGQVDIGDLVELSHYFTQGRRYKAPDEAADMNKDGRVDMADLSILAAALSE